MPETTDTNTITDVYSTEVPELLQSHLDHLLKSKISIEIIKGRGYRSIYGSDPFLKEIGFTTRQCRRPGGILLPMYGVKGNIVNYQYRPDNPRIQTSESSGKQRTIKYETPTGSRNHFDIHPAAKEHAGNPHVQAWIVEGLKKADSLLTAGAKFVIALAGVANWRGTNDQDGKTAIPDFEDVAWNDRLVYIAFDSDAWSKKEVAVMLQRLAAYLKSKGADVRIIKFADGPEGQKIGADDYLAQGHTLQDIIGLENPETMKPTLTLKEKSNNKYHMHEGCLCFVKPLQNGGELHTILCNFSAKIVEDIIKDNGQDLERYFRIIGTSAAGKQFPIIVVPDAEFDSMKWVRVNWGIGAIIEAGQNIKDHLREAILTNSMDAVKDKRIYAHTGWREVDGQKIYLTQGGSIGKTKVDVELPSPLDTYYLPDPEGDPCQAIKTSLEFLKISKPFVTLPVWAAMYAAPLSEIITPAFTLWYEGGTGSFKSVITSLALSHYGNFDMYKLPAAWRDTIPSIEKKLFLVKDAPMIIDDWAPGITQNKSHQLEEKAEEITRSQGNKQSKGRNKADMSSQKIYPPRGMLITQGEQLPGGASQNARIFTVEIQEEDTNVKLLTQAQHQQEKYRVAMAHYILWLSENYDDLQKNLHGEWEELREKAKRKNQHPRLSGVVATLQIGLNMALLFAQKHKAIDSKEAKKISLDSWDILMDLALQQETRVNEQGPAFRFFEGLKASVNMKTGLLIDVIEGEKLQPNQVFMGWQDRNLGEVWLDPEGAWTAVYQYYQRSGDPLTNKKKAVWKDMLRLGYIRRGSRDTINKRIEGIVRRVYRLKPNLLKEAEPDAEDNKNV